jgi:hypothetical protein
MQIRGSILISSYLNNCVANYRHGDIARLHPLDTGFDYSRKSKIAGTRIMPFTWFSAFFDQQRRSWAD